MFNKEQIQKLETSLIQDVIKRAVFLMKHGFELQSLSQAMKQEKFGLFWSVENSLEAQDIQSYFQNNIVYCDQETLIQQCILYLECIEDSDLKMQMDEFILKYREIEKVNDELSALEAKLIRSKSLLKNMDQETKWLSKVNTTQIQKIDAYQREHRDYTNEFQKESERLANLEETSTKLYEELVPTLQAYEKIKSELSVLYRSKTNLENQLNLFSYVFHPKNSMDIADKLKQLNIQITDLEKKHLQLIDQKVKKERKLTNLSYKIDASKKLHDDLKIKEERSKKELDKAIRENTLGSQHTQSFEKRYEEVKQRIVNEELAYQQQSEIFESLKRKLFESSLTLLRSFGKQMVLPQDDTSLLRLCIPIFLMSGTKGRRYVEELDSNWNVEKF